MSELMRWAEKYYEFAAATLGGLMIVVSIIALIAMTAR